MKKLTFLLLLILSAAAAYSQQAPISENYFMDKYSFSPSYAGNFNPKYLIMGFRSDWSGIDGGPKTYRISYNDAFGFMKNAGYGGKIIYDKAGIFNQLYILGSYSYNLEINQDHHIMFGLSMGVYKNRLNLLDFYNDPNYTIDPALVSMDINSKLKFTSEISAVWQWKNLEAGLLFSNLSFGPVRYKEVDLQYNPLYNFQIHGTYLFTLSEKWDLSPLVIVRGGKDVTSQVEVAAQAMYSKKIWGTMVFRDQGVLGVGLGANIDRGLKLAYNFNFATNIPMGAFNNHEISLGINIFNYIRKEDKN
jgi:type IX secretion system PorP/SprF family membrane protein